MSNFQMAKGVLHTYKKSKGRLAGECCLGRVTDGGGRAGNGLWRWLREVIPSWQMIRVNLVIWWVGMQGWR